MWTEPPTSRWNSSAIYLRSRGVTVSDDDRIAADEGAEYEREVVLDLSSLAPAVAFPHLPSNVRFLGKDDIGKIRIDQVVIGSCTNGRIGDMRAAAGVMKGHKVADGVRCIVIPATHNQDFHGRGSRGVHAHLRTVPRRVYGHTRGG